MRKTVLVAAWIFAVVATTAIAYVAVTAAGAEVTDRPLTSVVASGATSTTAVAASTSVGGAIPTSTSPGPTTTEFGSTGTTSDASTTTTTGSTSSTATTATTAPEAPWQQTTIPSSGGLVIVSYRPGEVRLESVAPTPGFTYEIDEAGPSEARVKFESGNAKVEIRVRWDGGLVTEVDENA